MRLFKRIVTLFAMLLCAASPAVAATSSEFYLSLLQRGIAAFEAERYAEATNHLKLAAFGLVDSIENYQSAQVYLALSYDHLGDAAKARDAARRVVAAERIERKFATIALPAGVASSFGALATRILGAADATYLRRPPQTATPPVQQQAKPQPQPPTVEAQPSQVAKATPPPPTAKPQAEPVSKPVQPVEKPVEKPAVKPPQVSTTNPPPATTKAQQPAPSKPIVPPATSQTTSPQTSAPQTPKPITAQESANRLAAGERALTSAQLAEARRIYRSLLDAPGVARDTLIRAAEGLYRARDFDGALLAFGKLGSLRRGEEPYHYYMAVAYYETGQYAKAKAELAAAVPFIEITPDVSRYRGKIEGAVD